MTDQFTHLADVHASEERLLGYRELDVILSQALTDFYETYRIRSSLLMLRLEAIAMPEFTLFP